MIDSATDSSALLERKEWGLLCQRLHDDGYLAFSNFFETEVMTATIERIQAIITETESSVDHVMGALGKNKKGLDVNLSTGECGDKSHPREAARELWKTFNNEHPALWAIRNHEKLQHTLREILERGGDVVVPKDQFHFQLPWVRAKGKGDVTGIHMDYHHLPTDFVRGDDVLEEDNCKVSFKPLFFSPSHPTCSLSMFGRGCQRLLRTLRISLFVWDRTN